MQVFKRVRQQHEEEQRRESQNAQHHQSYFNGVAPPCGLFGFVGFWHTQLLHVGRFVRG